MYRIFSIVLLLFSFIPASSYATYTISPVELHFYKGMDVVSLSVKNETNQQRHFQLTLFTVEEQGKKEKLTHSNDLLITPVMFRLEGNKSQLIRVAKKTSGEKLARKYRLSIKELPHGKIESNTVKLVLEFSVPITFDEES